MNEIVGYLIIANIGTIVAVAAGVLRIVWFIAKLDGQVKSNSEDIDAVHQKIRDIQNHLINKGSA